MASEWGRCSAIIVDGSTDQSQSMKPDTLAREISLALRNVLRQRRRALLALGTIVGGVICMLLAGGFIQWIFQDMRESTIRSQLGHIQVVRPGFFEKGIADPYAFLLGSGDVKLPSLEAMDGVRLVAPRLVFSGLISHGEETISFAGEGVDPQKEKELSQAMTIVAGEGLSPADSDGILLGEGLAANLGVKVGDPVVLLGTTAQGSINGVDAHVRGIFATITKSFDDSALRAPLPLAQQLVRIQGVTSWVMLLDKTENTEPVVRSLRGSLTEKEYELVPWYSLADFYNKTVVLFSRQVGVVQVLIALIIVLSISNTLSMTVIERTGEIGTTMALGVNRTAVLRQFVMEGLLLGIIGGAVGLGSGWLLAQVISAIGIPMPPPPGMARGYIGQILITPGLATNAFLLAVTTTFVASLAPAWKASRMVIVDALRHQR